MVRVRPLLANEKGKEISLEVINNVKIDININNENINR